MVLRIIVDKAYFGSRSRHDPCHDPPLALVQTRALGTWTRRHIGYTPTDSAQGPHSPRAQLKPIQGCISSASLIPENLGRRRMVSFRAYRAAITQRYVLATRGGRSPC